MLHEFWSTAPVRGVHPADKEAIDSSNSLKWSAEVALSNQDTYARDNGLHSKLHINLHPQPFIGDVAGAWVYILFGNPGLIISDYKDELRNRAHAGACAANLRSSKQGFFPLLAASDGTGVANYWRSRFKALIQTIANSLTISLEAARAIVVRRLCLIESGAYHSTRFPGNWCDDLESSKVAKRYVREVLLPKAREGNVLIFVWRRAKFWELLPIAGRVLLRAPEKAQLSYLGRTEVAVIADFLVRRIRGGK